MNMKLIKNVHMSSMVWMGWSKSKNQIDRLKRGNTVDVVQAVIWEEIKWEILF